MCKLLNGTNSFASFPLTWVPSTSSMRGSMMGSSTGVYLSPSPRLLVSTILPCSEMFAHQKCASTSSWPTMSSSVMLSCGGISLPSRGVVRGGCVARMPTNHQPPRSSLLPHLICSVSEELKFARKHLVNFALKLNQALRKGFS